MRCLGLSLAMVLVGLSLTASAQQRVATTEKPVKVRLEVFKPTSIEFPEPIINVNALELPDQYTFKAVGVYLFLTAKLPEVESRLFVVGQTGQQYQVDFSVGEPADVVVRLARPQPQTVTKGQPFTLASWFRALRLNQPIPGQRAAEVPRPSLPDTRLAIVSSGAVRRGTTIGMVLHLHNTTDATVLLDERIGETAPPQGPQVMRLAQWGWPPKLSLEALALEATRLEPGQTTRLYVVFEQR